MAFRARLVLLLLLSFVFWLGFVASLRHSVWAWLIFLSLWPVAYMFNKVIDAIVDHFVPPGQHHGPPNPEECGPRCLNCGYNLRGNLSGRCPECGAKRSGFIK